MEKKYFWTSFTFYTLLFVWVKENLSDQGYIYDVGFLSVYVNVIV